MNNVFFNVLLPWKTEKGITKFKHLVESYLKAQ